jgi:hypothetical protein
MAAIKIIRDFAPADRYVYDFGVCHYKRGFAQVDTSQDASYFGTWANPFKFQVVTYCEGDVTLQIAENGSDFANLLREIKAWNNESGHEFHGIDGMCDNTLIQEFRNLGLGDLLH